MNSTLRIVALLFMLATMFISACSFEPPLEGNMEDAAEATIKPVVGPEDIACAKNYQCMTLEFGCCPGDETVAINRAKVFTLKRAVVKYCSPLLTNQDRCKGKKNRLFPPKTECRELKCAVIK